MNTSRAALLQAIRGPIMLMMLGMLLAADHFDSYSFSRTWPALIIVFGILKLLERLALRPQEHGGGM